MLGTYTIESRYCLLCVTIGLLTILNVFLKILRPGIFAASQLYNLTIELKEKTLSNHF